MPTPQQLLMLNTADSIFAGITEDFDEEQLDKQKQTVTDLIINIRQEAAGGSGIDRIVYLN